MNEIMLSPDALMLVPLVAMVLQLVKSIKSLARFSEWFPVASVGLGVALAYATAISNPAVAGIMIGLMACGAFDLLKQKQFTIKEKPCERSSLPPS